MTVTHVNAQGNVGGTVTATSTGSSWPGIAAGQRVIAIVGFINNLSQRPPTPEGWRYIGHSIGGHSEAIGTSAGPRGLAFYEYDWQGSDPGGVVFNNPGSSDQSIWMDLVTVSKSDAYWQNSVAVFGTDTDKATDIAATMASNPTTKAGDMVYFGGATIPTSSNPTYSLTWTGNTGSSLATVLTGSGGGLGTRLNIRRRTSTAAGSAAPSIAGSTGVAGAGTLGVLVVSDTADAPPTGMVEGVSATRLSSTSVQVSWTHPPDAGGGVSIARAAGTHTLDGTGKSPGDVGYDPLTISGAVTVASGLTSSPYTDTVPSAGTYTYWVGR